MATRGTGDLHSAPVGSTAASDTGEPTARGSLRERVLRDLPVAERRLDLAGVSTAVLEGGQGSPVVLLHGPGAHAAHWLEIVPGLVGEHRVVVPDLPGHGSSSSLEGRPDLARLLAWLDELVERTCPSPPALVGHLAGGALAARFAVERRRQLSRLVLVDSFGLGELRIPPEFAQSLTRFFSLPSAESHEELWEHCAFDPGRLRARMGARWRALAAYDIECASRGGAFPALVEELGRVVPDADLGSIRVPTTLVCGRHDRVTLASAEQASARLGWPLRIVEGAADDPVLEQPESLLLLLSAALAAH